MTSPDPTTIAASRREERIEAHVANRLRDTERFKGAVRGLLGTIENLAFPVDYVKGYDQEDVVGILKDWAGVSRERVKEIATEEAVDRVNEEGV